MGEISFTVSLFSWAASFLLQGPLCPCEMTETVDACLEPGGARTGSGYSLGGKEEG